jgi:hypothetical protein
MKAYVAGDVVVEYNEAATAITQAKGKIYKMVNRSGLHVVTALRNPQAKDQIELFLASHSLCMSFSAICVRAVTV